MAGACAFKYYVGKKWDRWEMVIVGGVGGEGEQGRRKGARNRGGVGWGGGGAHILAGLVCCKELLELVRLPSRRNKNEDETRGQTRLPRGNEESVEADRSLLGIVVLGGTERSIWKFTA
jgi:hypothetical protein